jgi:FixJ family two-component response regulator
VIALSAITENQFKNATCHTLFDDFMEKPVQASQLKSVLEKAY